MKGPFVLIKAEFNGHRTLTPKVKSKEAPNLQIMEKKAKRYLCGSGIAFTVKTVLLILCIRPLSQTGCEPVVLCLLLNLPLTHWTL